MPEAQDLATAIAVEVAKQLPVQAAYDDGLSPGMKQVGALVEDLTKTLRLALFPLQLGAWAQDKFAGFLKESIDQVPPERWLPPPGPILGPILEGIKYEEAEGELWEMFSNLLSNSMDSAAPFVHPAYPKIVAQLAPLEAVLLQYLWEAGDDGYIQSVYEQEGDRVKLVARFLKVGAIREKSEAIHENIDIFFEHLESLNIFTEHATGNGTTHTLSKFGIGLMAAANRVS